MTGNYKYSARVAVLIAALICSLLLVSNADAYRICSFRGTVVDHGWRTMTVRSGGRCYDVNVSWRTKFIPNRRPCIGERVSVDFTLENGYMKATKVLSLNPTPRSVQCYPPPPPSSAVCRRVSERSQDVCPRGRPVCSRRPPSYVTGRGWKPRTAVKRRKRTAKKPPSFTKKPVEKKEEEKPPKKVEAPAPKSLTGEVVATSPGSLSIRVTEEGKPSEVVRIKVGLRTRFIPFRRPAVREKVKVDYEIENGHKFGTTVQVIQ